MLTWWYLLKCNINKVYVYVYLSRNIKENLSILWLVAQTGQTIQFFQIITTPTAVTLIRKKNNYSETLLISWTRWDQGKGSRYTKLNNCQYHECQDFFYYNFMMFQTESFIELLISGLSWDMVISEFLLSSVLIEIVSYNIIKSIYSSLCLECRLWACLL